MQKFSHPNRKKMRLKNYDYSQNWYYFVTICTKWRECFFGKIIDWKMILNECGKIAEKEIMKTEEIRKEIKIDIFVIMPNHLHLIMVIDNPVGNTGPCSLQLEHKNTLSNCIQRIKSQTTREIRKKYENFEFGWQKSFYDVIIRNEEQLLKTREYIENNPLKWELDKNNPENIEK